MEITPYWASRFVLASEISQGVLVPLLAAHTLGWFELGPPLREAIAIWAALNALAAIWIRRSVRAPMSGPETVPKICPYCEGLLVIGSLECPSCGELRRIHGS
jgi:hypothetical protein